MSNSINNQIDWLLWFTYDSYIIHFMYFSSSNFTILIITGSTMNGWHDCWHYRSGVMRCGETNRSGDLQAVDWSRCLMTKLCPISDRFRLNVWRFFLWGDMSLSHMYAWNILLKYNTYLLLVTQSKPLDKIPDICKRFRISAVQPMFPFFNP